MDNYPPGFDHSLLEGNDDYIIEIRTDEGEVLCTVETEEAAKDVLMQLHGEYNNHCDDDELDFNFEAYLVWEDENADEEYLFDLDSVLPAPSLKKTTTTQWVGFGLISLLIVAALVAIFHYSMTHASAERYSQIPDTNATARLYGTHFDKRANKGYCQDELVTEQNGFEQFVCCAYGSFGLACHWEATKIAVERKGRNVPGTIEILKDLQKNDPLFGTISTPN